MGAEEADVGKQAVALAPFSAAEREDFFASIARHRRAAMRIGWLADACALVLALVVAMLMAPLLYPLLRPSMEIIKIEEKKKKKGKDM